MGAVAGRTPAGRTISVGTTNADPTLTSAGSLFQEEDDGKTVTGTGIPADTVIDSVTSAAAAEMDANATATATVTATLGEGDPSTYGFDGWTPETDAEAESYAFPSASPAGTLADSVSAIVRRWRA